MYSIHPSARRRGQGATEYLVLLAVVLIVAMVGIGLLSYFPGLAGDAQKSQSDAYWRGEARPFMVTDAQQTTSGNLTLAVQNAESDTRLLTYISVYGGPVNGGYAPNTSEQLFTPGESRIYSIPIFVGGAAVSPSNPACTAGSAYAYYINFTYTNGEGTISGQKQFGAKTLNGKCV